MSYASVADQSNPHGFQNLSGGAPPSTLAPRTSYVGDLTPKDIAKGDRPSTAQIISWHNRLRGLYANRNMEYYLLRRIFDAQYVGNQAGNAIASATEFSDRKKLVYNMLNTAVRRYMDEMSAPVSIRGVPRALNEDDVRKAETRQKLLTELFENEDMVIKIVMASYYQSLLDKAIWHVRPDPSKRLKVALDLVIPEWYFPVPKSGYWFNKQAVIVSWIDFHIDGNMEQFDPEGRRYQNDQGLWRTIEYWDEHWYIRVRNKWTDPKTKPTDPQENSLEDCAIRHDWGFLPFEEAHNIPIPHRQRGQGDADQSVGLNEYLNELMSDQGDTLAYLANPIVVVRGTKQGTGQLVFGPRAIWELERDGSAEILTWAGSPPSFEAQILRVMQGIEDSTGLSSPAFGREIPSGVSGDAIRSILAGFNTRVGAKQSFMGHALNKICEKVQAIWEKEFPNEEFEVPGQWGLQPANGGEGENAHGIFIKPKDFLGHHKTRIIFEPQNETVRVFAELEKMGKGVQSKLTTMRNLGVVNPDEEYKRILVERHLDMLNSARAGITGNQMGTSPMPPAYVNRLGGGAGGFVPPGQQGMTLPGGQPPGPPAVSPPDFNIAELAKKLTASNPGTLADMLGVPQAEQLQKSKDKNVIKVHDVIDKIRGLDLSGRVQLEGDIVHQGATTDKFSLRVQNEADIPQIRQALGPQMAERANFVTQKEPWTSGSVVHVGGPLEPQFRTG